MNITAARDMMNEMVLMAWQPRYAIWDNVKGEPPSEDIPWIRTSIRHFGGGQGSLGDNLGRVKWERRGIIVIQLFVPNGIGLVEHDSLVDILMSVFEKPNIGTIWFLNTHVREIGIDGRWYQSNIESDFSYEEIK